MSGEIIETIGGAAAALLTAKAVEYTFYYAANALLHAAPFLGFIDPLFVFAGVMAFCGIYGARHTKNVAFSGDGHNVMNILLIAAGALFVGHGILLGMLGDTVTAPTFLNMVLAGVITLGTAFLFTGSAAFGLSHGRQAGRWVRGRAGALGLSI